MRFFKYSPIQEFLYLFLIDPITIGHSPYARYIENEPGYSACLLQAYVKAFEYPTLGLSHDLIKTIHKRAMQHLPESNPGHYRDRDTSVGFKLVSRHFKSEKSYIEKIPGDFTVTEMGIKEFITFWLKKNNVKHYLNFSELDPFQKNKVDNQIPIGSDGVGNFVISTFENVQLKTKEIIKSEDLLLSKINQLLTSKICRIRTGDTSTKEIEDELTALFESYQKDIQNAITNDDKIRTIAKYVQRINQCHPFKDGNIRTCYVLINKLLKDQGLGLTILLQPNILDAFGTDEIVKMIKGGQKLYNDILHFATRYEASSTDELRFNFQIDSIDITLPFKPIVLKEIKNKYIVESFVNKVLLITTNDSKQVNPLVLEMEKANIDLERTYPIIEAVEKDDYALALRRACLNHEYVVIQLILNSHVSFDINIKSSNGKTALDWFNEKKPKSDEFEATRQLLIDKGAKLCSELNYAPSLES